MTWKQIAVAKDSTLFLTQSGQLYQAGTETVGTPGTVHLTGDLGSGGNGDLVGRTILEIAAFSSSFIAIADATVSGAPRNVIVWGLNPNNILGVASAAGANVNATVITSFSQAKSPMYRRNPRNVRASSSSLFVIAERSYPFFLSFFRKIP
jgi:alpha-tubulin suppressor-like RCC1 family protein